MDPSPLAATMLYDSVQSVSITKLVGDSSRARNEGALVSFGCNSADCTSLARQKGNLMLSKYLGAAIMQCEPTPRRTKRQSRAGGELHGLQRRYILAWFFAG